MCAGCAPRLSPQPPALSRLPSGTVRFASPQAPAVSRLPSGVRFASPQPPALSRLSPLSSGAGLAPRQAAAVPASPRPLSRPPLPVPPRCAGPVPHSRSWRRPPKSRARTRPARSPRRGQPAALTRAPRRCLCVTTPLFVLSFLSLPSTLNTPPPQLFTAVFSFSCRARQV